MNHKTNVTFIMIVFVLGVAAMTSLSLVGYTSGVAIDQQPIVQVLGRANSGKVAGVAVEQADVVIDRGTGTKVRTNFDVATDSTALDALEGASQAFGMTIETKWYGGEAGTLVTSVGGLNNGQDNKYWMYYLNGTLGTVAMDKQIVKPGDTIEFRFEKSPF